MLKMILNMMPAIVRDTTYNLFGAFLHRQKRLNDQTDLFKSEAEIEQKMLDVFQMEYIGLQILTASMNAVLLSHQPAERELPVEPLIQMILSYIVYH